MVPIYSQEFVRLVPGNRVVVTGRLWEGVRFQMYDVLQLPISKVPAPEDTEERTPPFWSALFQTGKESPVTHFISKPYRFPAPDVDRGIMRLMVRAQTGLHVVNVRETVTVEGAEAEGGGSTTRTERNLRDMIPDIVHLIDGFMQANGKVTPWRATKVMAEFFGTRTGIVICEDNSVLVLRYDSATLDSRIVGRPSSPHTTCFLLPASQKFTNVCVDERSGRVVLFDTSSHKMVVMDFALMYGDVS